MMPVVVDTNVPVVANGQSEQASEECVMACVERLREVVQRGRVVLDNQWLILQEYIGNLRSEGQPGVGDGFLRWVLENQASRRCVWVSITPITSNGMNFAEFPNDPALEAFDPSDRKFVAVAVASEEMAPILQATDAKWWDFREVLSRHGVEVDFLCADYISDWLAEAGIR